MDLGLASSPRRPCGLGMATINAAGGGPAAYIARLAETQMIARNSGGNDATSARPRAQIVEPATEPRQRPGVIDWAWWKTLCGSQRALTACSAG